MANATTTYPVMTMAEMERVFDQEWVLIVDPVIDPVTSEIGHGAVAVHSSDRDYVESQIDVVDPSRFAVYFMGKIPWDGTYLL